MLDCMRTHAVTLTLLLSVAPAVAAPPDVGDLVRVMRTVLEPSRPSVRKMAITISAESGEATKWVAGQARKPSPDGDRILVAILAPADQKGAAYLLREVPNQANDEEWVYLPVVRRVRKILPLESFRSFLDSDFTLWDLGLVDVRATYTFLREETRDDVHAYVIQEVPLGALRTWYYSRVVTWLAADSSLPLERDFHDPAGVLWKVETFQQVTTVNGVPTPLALRMEDRQSGGSTDIVVSDVRYDVDLPDALFDPAHLRDAAASPLW
jgi:hypothetical protein